MFTLGHLSALSRFASHSNVNLDEKERFSAQTIFPHETEIVNRATHQVMLGIGMASS